MENTMTLHALDEFAKTKPKDIPKELEDYLRFVAASGDPVYQWSLVKFLFRQKLLNVIMEFYESSPMMDVPLSSNLDPFNYETIKKRLLERYDLFSGVPFTIQRIAELLIAPRKQYSRLDKYMRALEKNIWVVSPREPVVQDNEQTNLVNGVFSSVLHSVDKKPDKLQRQYELLDSEEEPPISSSDDEITNETSTEQQPESLTEPLPTPDSGNIVSEANNEETSASSNKNDEIHVPMPVNEKNDRVADEKSNYNETDDNSERDLKEEIPSKDVQDEVKTEPTIIAEPEDAKSIEPCEKVIEPAEPAIEKADEAIPPEEVKVDLKRKIDEVEPETPEEAHKKQEIELPVAVEEQKAHHLPESAATEVAEVEETKSYGTEIAEELHSTETELKEAVDMERALDSAEMVEMMVEEPEQMEVDESSLQSPMAEDQVQDVAEPMDEVEPGTS